MVPKYSITFHEVEQPITELVTKFGGQPAWLGAPTWPLSRSTGEPMRFICQVALDAHLFGEIPGQMAYLFMTDGEKYVDTYAADGGENAVIIQPGTWNAPTQPLKAGPTLYKMVGEPSGERFVPVSCEFAVDLSLGEDPEVIVEDEHASEEAQAKFNKFLSESKISGTPVFLQDPEFPSGDNWQLLLQLDSASAPFSVNFGDAGIGYAFLSGDGKIGKFLWQCL